MRGKGILYVRMASDTPQSARKILSYLRFSGGHVHLTGHEPEGTAQGNPDR
jgi:hypothetical protein